MKRQNNDGTSSAEVGGRRGGKAADQGEHHTSNTRPTQSGERVSHGLAGVRRAAKARKTEKFTALLHHVTVGLLRDSFYALKREAAPGVDGITSKEYEAGPENRIGGLHGRIHRGAYQALSSRRVYIPRSYPAPTNEEDPVKE